MRRRGGGLPVVALKAGYAVEQKGAGHSAVETWAKLDSNREEPETFSGKAGKPFSRDEHEPYNREVHVRICEEARGFFFLKIPRAYSAVLHERKGRSKRLRTNVRR